MEPYFVRLAILFLPHSCILKPNSLTLAMLRDLIRSLIKLSLSTATIFYSLVACFIILGLVSATFATLAGDQSSTQQYTYGKRTAYSEILQIPIHGVIENDQAGSSGPLSSLGGSSVYGTNVKQELYDAADDPRIKGVVLDIDSPGGSISGSQAIADGVAYYRNSTHQPVYTHVSEMAASGGYWSAVSTDRILADVGSTVGSIGVIMGTFKYYNGVISEDSGILSGGVTTKNGIETTTLSAGQYKDTGNPYRPLTQEEIAHYQSLLDSDYTTFVKHVSSTRSIPEDTIRNQIKALLYGTEQASHLKLIDEVGNRETAYQEVASKAGLKSGDYQVVEQKVNQPFVSSLLGAINHTSTPRAQLSICGGQQILAFSGDLASACR